MSSGLTLTDATPTASGSFRPVVGPRLVEGLYRIAEHRGERVVLQGVLDAGPTAVDLRASGRLSKPTARLWDAFLLIPPARNHPLVVRSLGPVRPWSITGRTTGYLNLPPVFGITFSLTPHRPATVSNGANTGAGPQPFLNGATTGRTAGLLRPAVRLLGSVWTRPQRYLSEAIPGWGP